MGRKIRGVGILRGGNSMPVATSARLTPARKSEIEMGEASRESGRERT